MISEYVLEADSFGSLDAVGGTVIDVEGATAITLTPGLDAVITLTNAAGQTIRLFTLTREQAEKTSKQELWGRERLVISAAMVVAAEADCWIYSRQPEVDLLVYPPLEAALHCDKRKSRRAARDL